VSWPIIHLVTVTGATWATSTAVLVVGGGPAELAAAAELGLHGIECVVIEPRAAVSHLRPRAKTTNVRTMEHLRRWGVADALRAAAPLPVAWSQRVTFCESLSGRRITDFENAFGLTTPDGWSARTSASPGGHSTRLISTSAWLPGTAAASGAAEQSTHPHNPRKEHPHELARTDVSHDGRAERRGNGRVLRRLRSHPASRQLVQHP
jgi:hypothetical protein